MLFCKAPSQWPPRISNTLISFAVLLISFIGQFIRLSGAQNMFQIPKTLSVSLHTSTNIVKNPFLADRTDRTRLLQPFLLLSLDKILFDNIIGLSGSLVLD